MRVFSLHLFANEWLRCGNRKRGAGRAVLARCGRPLPVLPFRPSRQRTRPRPRGAPSRPAAPPCGRGLSPARVPRGRTAPLLPALHSDLQSCLRSFGCLARMAGGRPGRAALLGRGDGGAGRGAHLGALPEGAGRERGPDRCSSPELRQIAASRVSEVIVASFRLRKLGRFAPLKELRGSAVRPLLGAGGSGAFVRHAARCHQSLFALHCIYGDNNVIALVFTETLSCISKKSHINYLQMSALFLLIDFPEVAKCFSLCSRLFIKRTVCFSLCLLVQTVKFAEGSRAPLCCSSLPIAQPCKQSDCISCD